MISETPELMESLTKNKMVLDSPKRDLWLATGKGGTHTTLPLL